MTLWSMLVLQKASCNFQHCLVSTCSVWQRLPTSRLWLQCSSEHHHINFLKKQFNNNRLYVLTAAHITCPPVFLKGCADFFFFFAYDVNSRRQHNCASSVRSLENVSIADLCARGNCRVKACPLKKITTVCKGILSPDLLRKITYSV